MTAPLHHRAVLKPDLADLTQSQKHYRIRLIATLNRAQKRAITAANLPARQHAIFALDDLIEAASRLQAVLMDKPVSGMAP